MGAYLRHKRGGGFLETFSLTLDPCRVTFCSVETLIIYWVSKKEGAHRSSPCA